MSFRQPETSYHRIHQRRFLRRPESTLWVIRAIRLFKTSLKQLYQSLFWMLRMQKMSSHGISTPWNIASSTSPKSFFKTWQSQIIFFSGPLDYLNHHFHDFVEVAFWMPRMWKLRSNGLLTSWNFASSTSPMLHSKIFRRLIMSS
jgi:hypothetical protein